MIPRVCHPLLAIAAVLVLSLPAVAQQGGAIARMGGATIGVDEVQRIVDEQPPEVRAQLATDPAALERALRTEVVRRAVLAEAKRQGWDQRPDVKARMQRAAEQALVSHYMNSIARAPRDYPSEAEIQAFYRDNPQRFTAAKRYHVRQIYVRLPEGDRGAVGAAAAKVSKLAAQAKSAGTDFAALARSSSEHALSAQQGGDLGWVEEGNLIPEMRPVLARMQPGQVSDPVTTDKGWHVVKLVDVRSEGLAPLDEVRPIVVNTLRLQRAREIEVAYLDDLVKRTPITLDQAAIARLRSAIK